MEDQLEGGLHRMRQALRQSERPTPAGSFEPTECRTGSWRPWGCGERWASERPEERPGADGLFRAWSNAVRGALYLFAAFVVLTAALVRPWALWWLAFLAFWLARAGIVRLSRVHRVSEEEPVPWPPTGDEAGEAQQSAAIELRQRRIERLCSQLAQDLKTAPRPLRELVHRPEKTLKSLQLTCRALAARELELLRALTAEDDRRLQRERAQLTGRLEVEPDPIVRQRLTSALTLLDQQLAQRVELRTAASRYDAESTRLLYTLEHLQVQLLRARSADTASADVAGTGLRQSLQQLAEEIDAAAAALEAVNAPETVAPARSPTSRPARALDALPSGERQEPRA